MENAYTALDIILQDKEQIKNVTGFYCNVLHNIYSKYPLQQNEDSQKYNERLVHTLNQADKSLIEKAVSQLRNYAIRINFEIESIAEEVKMQPETLNEYRKCFQEIESKRIPDYGTTTQFVQLVVKFLNKTVRIDSVLNLKKNMDKVSNAVGTSKGVM